MNPDVRLIRADELQTFVDTMSTGFLERPDAARIAAELVSLWDLDRTWAAFDGDRMCGTFRTWGTEMTLPGGAQLPGRRRVGCHRAADPSPARDPAPDGRCRP